MAGIISSDTIKVTAVSGDATLGSASSAAARKEQAEELVKSNKRRKVYFCSKCGQPKKGHTCINRLKSDESSGVPATSANSSQRSGSASAAIA